MSFTVYVVMVDGKVHSAWDTEHAAWAEANARRGAYVAVTLNSHDPPVRGTGTGVQAIPPPSKLSG